MYVQYICHFSHTIYDTPYNDSPVIFFCTWAICSTLMVYYKLSSCYSSWPKCYSYSKAWQSEYMR